MGFLGKAGRTGDWRTWGRTGVPTENDVGSAAGALSVAWVKLTWETQQQARFKLTLKAM